MEFLTLLLEMKGMTPLSLLTFFILVFFRLAPIVSLCPFFGAKLVPSIGKAGLAFFLSIVYLPIVIANSTTMVDYNLAFIGLGLKEFVIGLIIGFLTNVPFYVVESAGSIIDYQRGASQLMSQDPTLKVQASSIGIMYNYILIVVFFFLSGPLYFLDAVSLSFEMVPVDHYINANFFHHELPIWKHMMNIMNYIFAMSIQMAAPALVGILMAETFLGIANRLAPQVQIAFLGMPLKSLLGLFVLWLGWALFIKQFGDQAMSYFEQFTNLLKTLKPFSLP